MSHKPEKDGCGFYIALFIICIPIAIFVPFLLIVVACAFLYLVNHEFKKWKG